MSTATRVVLTPYFVGLVTYTPRDPTVAARRCSAAEHNPMRPGDSYCGVCGRPLSPVTDDLVPGPNLKALLNLYGDRFHVVSTYETSRRSDSRPTLSVSKTASPVTQSHGSNHAHVWLPRVSAGTTDNFDLGSVANLYLRGLIHDLAASSDTEALPALEINLANFYVPACLEEFGTRFGTELKTLASAYYGDRWPVNAVRYGIVRYTKEES